MLKDPIATSGMLIALLIALINLMYLRYIRKEPWISESFKAVSVLCLGALDVLAVIGYAIVLFGEV